MVKTIIVGGGFSAALAYILLGSKVKVITPMGENNIHLAQTRRCAFEINKFFSNKSKSFGSLQAKLKINRLHDRLSLGGNSSIWGGFIDQLKVPSFFISQLKNYNINIIPISKAVTGSTSNTKSIAQIQFFSEQIFDAAKILLDSTSGYLESFRIINNVIELCVLDDSLKEDSRANPIRQTIQVEKLVLCIGVVQLIDLLYRSHLIKDGDEISLYEFPCKFKISFVEIKVNSNNSCIIQYTLGRAICHLLGIQKYNNLLRYIDLFPIFINQEFLYEEKEIHLIVDKGYLKEKNSNSAVKNLKYGTSIHYCCMRINGEGINEFLNRFSNNIIGLGMAFVKQDRPGPISNDILVDALKKLN